MEKNKHTVDDAQKMKHKNEKPNVIRRNLLQLLGASSAVLLAGKSFANPPKTLPSCVITPAQTEGPYFVDDNLFRSDIRTDPTDGSIKEGIPLKLEINVSTVSNGKCKPLTNAAVDIWHCDAQGIYSDVQDFSFNTVGKKFLRGFQMTDADGKVHFTTIYPGWYPGRTVHIHFKIRARNKAGQMQVFTSQLYFDDAVTDHVYTLPPYSNRDTRFPRNHRDGIFRRGGQVLLVNPLENKNKEYVARLNVGIQTDGTS